MEPEGKISERSEVKGDRQFHYLIFKAAYTQRLSLPGFGM